MAAHMAPPVATVRPRGDLVDPLLGHAAPRVSARPVKDSDSSWFVRAWAGH